MMMMMMMKQWALYKFFSYFFSFAFAVCVQWMKEMETNIKIEGCVIIRMNWTRWMNEEEESRMGCRCEKLFPIPFWFIMNIYIIIIIWNKNKIYCIKQRIKEYHEPYTHTHTHILWRPSCQDVIGYSEIKINYFQFTLCVCVFVCTLEFPSFFGIYKTKWMMFQERHKEEDDSKKKFHKNFFPSTLLCIRMYDDESEIIQQAIKQWWWWRWLSQLS